MSVPKRTAETSVPIHTLISERWSPRAFANRAVEPEKLRELFEAARWAASSYNGQPWYFIVATKEHGANYKKMLDSFVEFNQSWAKGAPALALSVAKLKFDHNGEPNRHALHDVGQAAANLSLQAHALGLAVHQMAGILPEKAREFSRFRKVTSRWPGSRSVTRATRKTFPSNCGSAKWRRASASRSTRLCSRESGERFRRSSQQGVKS